MKTTILPTNTSIVITVGYHFVGETLRDGRPVPPDGEWLEHEGPLVRFAEMVTEAMS